MPSEEGMTRILRLQRKWRREAILLRLVQALGLSLLLGTIFYQFTPFSAYLGHTSLGHPIHHPALV